MMLIFKFKATDFDLHELYDQLNKEKTEDGISFEFTKEEVATDGQRAFWEDVLSVITVANVSKAVLTGSLSFLVKEGLSKAKEIAFSEPYILVRFSNGGKRKILYDKGHNAIAQELIDLVSNGDVVSTEFKS